MHFCIQLERIDQFVYNCVCMDIFGVSIVNQTLNVCLAGYKTETLNLDFLTRKSVGRHLPKNSGFKIIGKNEIFSWISEI